MIVVDSFAGRRVAVLGLVAMDFANAASNSASLIACLRSSVRAREKLAKISGIILAHPGLKIAVEGHTDSVGGDAYNMKLSARRADTVKSYLVESAGIPADKVTARGADGDNPVTKPDECPGRKRTPKLIACLQPDRRVDVEVVGSKLQAAPNN